MNKISLSEPLLILAGDVGGTKTNLAILRATFSQGKHVFSILRSERYASQDYSGLETILHQFLDGEPLRPVIASFGVPGAVKNGRVQPTNLKWMVDAEKIRKECGFHLVEVINDLMANAYGISELQSDDFVSLNPFAVPVEGNRAVISPGTGLGEAGIFWDGEEHTPWACEGGHTDFAPRNPTEIALLEFLMQEYGRVSYERIACGLGLSNVYRFLRDTGRESENPLVAEEMQHPDAAAVISNHALEGDCSLCVEALRLFIEILGAEAGNLALKAMAVNGVFLGGGIPVKILSKLQEPAFLEAFIDKGRLSPLLKAMPVHVILNDQAAVFGAARRALIALSKKPSLQATIKALS